MQIIYFLKKNISEIFLIILCALGIFGSQPNYVALVLCILVAILLWTQQKHLGLIIGGLVGFIGLYLCLALFSDASKIEDFSTIKSIQFVGVGSLLCLGLISSSFILIKKYFPK